MPWDRWMGNRKMRRRPWVLAVGGRSKRVTSLWVASGWETQPAAAHVVSPRALTLRPNHHSPSTNQYLNKLATILWVKTILFFSASSCELFFFSYHIIGGEMDFSLYTFYEHLDGFHVSYFHAHDVLKHTVSFVSGSLHTNIFFVY